MTVLNRLKSDRSFIKIWLPLFLILLVMGIIALDFYEAVLGQDRSIVYVLSLCALLPIQFTFHWFSNGYDRRLKELRGRHGK